MASVNVTYRETTKENTISIVLRVIINRKMRQYSLGINIQENNFDKVKQIVKRGELKYIHYNKVISKQKQKAENIILEKELSDEVLTIAKFDKLFKSAKTSLLFSDYVNKIVNDTKYALKASTKKKIKSEASKLEKFKKDVLLKDINSDFIDDYIRYMKEELNNTQNTVSKTLTVVKSVINKAIQNKDFHGANPFEGIKIKTKRANREFLNKDELLRLEKLYKNEHLDRSIHNVLRYFLFSCYTGLRYSDIVNLKYRNIDSGFINIKMEKTSEHLRIPLNKNAEALLSDVKHIDKKVFRTYVNQVTNRHLKAIQVLAEINKTLTFHVARHTFATMAISLGVPIEVISKLLGHTDIKTTQIYAKILDDVKVDAMKKFNEAFS